MYSDSHVMTEVSKKNGRTRKRQFVEIVVALKKMLGNYCMCGTLHALGLSPWGGHPQIRFAGLLGYYLTLR